MQTPQRNPNLLLNPVFLTALLLLICNDQYWKYAYGNILTGKLSDFSGMVLLPLVLSFLFPTWRARSIWFSTLLFLFWKSPWSGPFIDFYNQFAPIPISRVVDYTDYLAFLILPLPYWLISCYTRTNQRNRMTWRPIASWGVLLITSLSFIATQPPPSFSFQHNTGNVSFYNCKYKMEMTREQVLQKLRSEGLKVMVDTALASQIHLRNYIYSDSILAHDPPFYRIPQLAIEKDTVYEVQFSLMTRIDNQVFFLLNGLRVEGLAETEVTRKLRRMYRKALEKELIKDRLR